MASVEFLPAVTWQSTFGSSLSDQQVRDALRTMHPYDFLCRLSTVAHALRPSFGVDLAKHFDLVNTFFPPTVATAISNHRKRGEGEWFGVFDQYCLNTIAEMVILFGDDGIALSDQLDKWSFAKVLMSAHDFLRPIELRCPDQYSNGQKQKATKAFSLKRQALPPPGHYVSELSRHYRLFVEYVNAHPPPSALGSTESLFRGLVGVGPLDHFLSGMILLVYAFEFLAQQAFHGPVVDIDRWLANISSRERINRFMENASLELSEYRQFVSGKENGADPFYWNLRPIYQYPYLKVGASRYLLLSPSALIHKITTGFFYEVANRLDGNLRDVLTQWLGDLLERYVGDLAADMFSHAVVNPTDTTGQVTDVLIPLGDTWIMMEVKWHFWSLSMSARGEMSRADREQLVSKPFLQISRALKRVFANPGLVVGTKLPKTVIPLVVGNVSLSEWPPITSMLDDEWRAVATGLPVAVLRPKMVSVADIENASSAPELFLPALDQWQKEIVKRESCSFLSSFLRLRGKDGHPHGRFVQAGWDRATNEMTKLMHEWGISRPTGAEDGSKG